MKRLTTSSANAYRACNRLYQLRYVEGVRSREKAHALHFGTLWHGLQEEWWRTRSCADAFAWLTRQPDVDPFDRVKLRELMRGYDARWGDSGLRAVRIEQEFSAPLINPETGAPSRTFQLAGKKDLIAEDAEGVWLVEHKTSGADITAGSDYWMALRMDSQVSNYYVGARANGHDILGCIYDVVAKPKMKPAKATPAESRKYKKDGTLYANQRDRDETPEEYEARLREHIAANPDAYYQRAPVVRLEAEEREAARDMWHTARAIRDSERLGSWPRNPQACFRWHRACDYWDVCTGQADIADEHRFERVRPHEELSENAEQNATNGESNGSSINAVATGIFGSDDAGIGF